MDSGSLATPPTVAKAGSSSPKPISSLSGEPPRCYSHDIFGADLASFSSYGRLLAGSGIDPRYALDFWENRLSSHQAESSPTSPSTALPFSQVNAVHHHSKNGTSGEASPTGLLDGYMRTHPVDEERLARIRQELKDWEAWNRSLEARVETA